MVYTDPPAAEAPKSPDNTAPAPANDPPKQQEPTGENPPAAKQTHEIHHPDGPGTGAGLTHTGADPNHGPTEKKNLTRSKQDTKAGDPIAFSDGSLELTATDLAFPGPARELTFVRNYRSSSRDRSAL